MDAITNFSLTSYEKELGPMTKMSKQKLKEDKVALNQIDKKSPESRPLNVTQIAVLASKEKYIKGETSHKEFTTSTQIAHQGQVPDSRLNEIIKDCTPSINKSNSLNVYCDLQHTQKPKSNSTKHDIPPNILCSRESNTMQLDNQWTLDKSKKLFSGQQHLAVRLLPNGCIERIRQKKTDHSKRQRSCDSTDSTCVKDNKQMETRKLKKARSDNLAIESVSNTSEHEKLATKCDVLNETKDLEKCKRSSIDTLLRHWKGNDNAKHRGNRKSVDFSLLSPVFRNDRQRFTMGNVMECSKFGELELPKPSDAEFSYSNDITHAFNNVNTQSIGKDIHEERHGDQEKSIIVSESLPSACKFTSLMLDLQPLQVQVDNPVSIEGCKAMENNSRQLSIIKNLKECDGHLAVNRNASVLDMDVNLMKTPRLKHGTIPICFDSDFTYHNIPHLPSSPIPYQHSPQLRIRLS